MFQLHMWKDYSVGFLKNNRYSSLSVRIAAFISALLLSLLCGLFYNAWKYEVDGFGRRKAAGTAGFLGNLQRRT